ncbi:hypothetical protein [Limosilactobacillus reuteri]
MVQSLRVTTNDTQPVSQPTTPLAVHTQPTGTVTNNDQTTTPQNGLV